MARGGVKVSARVYKSVIIALLSANLGATILASHIATRGQIVTRGHVAATSAEAADAEMVHFSIPAKMLEMTAKTCRPGSAI
jgi:hypothetical protein